MPTVYRSLSPDLILHNGRIAAPDAQLTDGDRTAIAVRGDRILVIGTDEALVPLAAPHTRLIDLGGRTVIPGIHDSHAHLIEVGAKLSLIRLDECQSPEEMMELVRARAADTPPGHWIVGVGWNEGNFRDGRLPIRQDIDPATSQHPVMLQRFFNTDLVNSYALRLAGITRNTPDPAEGRIERDAEGEPNGLLRAKAKGLARRLLPKPSERELISSVVLGCRALNKFGITSVIDPGLYPAEIRAYQRARDTGLLSVRMNLMPNWHGFRDDEHEAQLDCRASELGIYSGLGDEWLRIGGLKMAIDGGTTPHTAYMYEPFEGETEVKNFNRLDPDQLYRYFRRAQELNWDVGIHCCGDRAQDIAVDALSRVAQELPVADTRHSIIHAYFPTEHALQLMGRHHIAAVIQPTFLYWEGDLIFRDVGRQRALNYKPARRYLDHGVVTGASSDVESTVSADPFVALYALVTRKNNLGHLVGPDQAIDRHEALHAYTMAGAWLTREEKLKGSLEPGKLADMVVLDQDYFTVPDESIRDVHALMTVIGGNIVWQQEGIFHDHRP